MGHTHIKSPHGLHQNDAKFQTYPSTTLHVKMANLPKSMFIISDIKLGLEF